MRKSLDFLQRKKALDDEWVELEVVLHELDIPTLYTPRVDKNGVIKFPIRVGHANYSDLNGWLKKAQYIISAVGKPLTSNEIIDIMLRDYEPNLSRQAAINSLPATLSVAAKEGKIIRKNRANSGEYEYYVN